VLLPVLNFSHVSLQMGVSGTSLMLAASHY